MWYYIICSFQLGEYILIYMVQIGLVVRLLQLSLDARLQNAQVFCVEELEFVGDLVHLSLLL